ncbi:hypothetical protein GmHk_01G002571 [Glycine max]|nr:hypothetical protein GmHk_01G002571 [Glycine max]
MGSLEKEPTFLSILFEVQTLSQTKISSELLSLPRALCSLCSSARRFFTRNACPATTTGIAAPKRDHQISPISNTQQITKFASSSYDSHAAYSQRYITELKLLIVKNPRHVHTRSGAKRIW